MSDDVTFPGGMTDSERRSWILHRELERELATPLPDEQWAMIEANVRIEQERVSGSAGWEKIQRWGELVARRDEEGLRAALTDATEHGIQMREVSPMSGMLSESSRRRALDLVARARAGDARVTVLLVVDVDGVVSAVRPQEPVWGDEVNALEYGTGVPVSPTLVHRLDSVASLPHVRPVWLTSWIPQMRAVADPFPGRGWETVRPAHQSRPLRWGKAGMLRDWLLAHNHLQLKRIVWIDDDVTYDRTSPVRRIAGRRDIDLVTIRPRLDQGITPAQMDHIVALCAHPTTPRRDLGLESGSTRLPPEPDISTPPAFW